MNKQIVAQLKKAPAEIIDKIVTIQVKQVKETPDASEV